MDIEEYFSELSKRFNIENSIASEARAKGYDPEDYVEILAAPDVASRVEGIVGLKGIADVIREESGGRGRPELAFRMAERICTDDELAGSIGIVNTKQRLEAAVRVGMSVLTEGVVVGPTEGMQGIEMHKNPDGSDYISVLYAGPVRNMGGTSVALSVALADLGRKLLGIGQYRAQQSEVERYIEEIQIYNARMARLQYMPSEADIKVILENCPVCVDGIPTGEFEVGTHRNVKRLDSKGKEEIITNKIRGGVCLVLCEGVAQKAKKVLEHTKNAGLDWGWLNNIIKVDKGTKGGDKKDAEKDAVFLHEQVAGRPVFGYPDHAGAFRLRYGRSRLTGIAAKGFSPATMILLKFIAIGTQLKIEKPGKGCVAMPVDSIEGPFVKLKSGEAFRINTAKEAEEHKYEISKILSIGDILVTHGDFKKTNTKLVPTSYVEEYWEAQLKDKGCEAIPEIKSFKDAYDASMKYSVPIHPRYLYEYQDVKDYHIPIMFSAIRGASLSNTDNTLFGLKSIRFDEDIGSVREILEIMCIPHTDRGDHIIVENGDAQSLLASFGFCKDKRIDLSAEYSAAGDDALSMVDSMAPFKIMRRSSHVGGRMGRPEKAGERLMKPTPNLLFPIKAYGGKERNISKAYSIESRKFKSNGIEIDVARFRCSIGKEYVMSGFCSVHGCSASIERYCRKCGLKTLSKVCESCGSKTSASETRSVSLTKLVSSSLRNLNMNALPKSVRGVKWLVSHDKVAEPLEKGILRSLHDIYVFKDGTCRFDATDAPMTHFYPKEIGTSVEKLVELGYTEDYKGNKLEREDQLVELKHQDIVMNRRGGEFLARVAGFVDDMLEKHYKMDRFYNASSAKDMVGKYVITLAPHTSAGVLGRIVGFTSANVGFCHPYLVCARRRNCDGDEDATMLLLDALINFSRSYLPTTIGGTMDAPLVLTINSEPEEVDDEVHEMEVVGSYPLSFYDATFDRVSPKEADIESVKSRLNGHGAFTNLLFSHGSSAMAIGESPNRSSYTLMKTMEDKINEQFKLMDMLSSIDRKDTAKRLIIGHFIPDLMGNLHSFSKQRFRCVSCNAKYRRVPLEGKCDRCGGKLLLTISKGGIKKYLGIALSLIERYDLEPYVKQRVLLLGKEIDTVFGTFDETNTKQFNLSRFL